MAAEGDGSLNLPLPQVWLTATHPCLPCRGRRALFVPHQASLKLSGCMGERVHGGIRCGSVLRGASCRCHNFISPPCTVSDDSRKALLFLANEVLRGARRDEDAETFADVQRAFEGPLQRAVQNMFSEKSQLLGKARDLCDV